MSLRICPKYGHFGMGGFSPLSNVEAYRGYPEQEKKDFEECRRRLIVVAARMGFLGISIPTYKKPVEWNDLVKIDSGMIDTLNEVSDDDHWSSREFEEIQNVYDKLRHTESIMIQYCDNIETIW